MPAGQAEDLLAAIEDFASARLLTLTHDTIAISHEILLTAWPRLRAWIEESQADQIARTRLRAAAADWARSGHDPAYLYRGSLLASAHAASARMDTNQLPLSRGERDFLNTSTRTNRRRARRERVAVVLLIVVLLVLVTENVILLIR